MVALAVALVLAGAAVLRALDMSQCIAPLGMESGLIPDKDISASSCYNDGNVAPQNGRLNRDIKGGAWCPRSQITAEAAEWLEVDLRAVHVVTAVGSQGRFGNGQGQEFAEEYLLEYWRPRLGKWVRYHSHDGQEILPGNKNTYLEQKNQLSPAVWASKVRFLPHSAHRRTVCMRVEIYGCLWNAGIVSYSMPAGDARSNGVELSDVSYDGTWSGGELRGGLGQLVDGEFGGDEIREPGRPSAWVGWRNDSRALPPTITFEFDRVREFRALHLYCNNRFMRDVQVFSEAAVSFSVGGRRYQDEPVRYEHAPDNIFESSRNVTVALKHRIGRWVRLELRFAARWILVSEAVFESEPARGNHSAEAGRERAAEAGAGAAPVPTARREDPLYVAVVVGVLTALAILVAVAVVLVVHRHRHRKCFASPLGKGAPPALPPRAADDYSACAASLPHKPADDYQEPYQALKCGPYLSHGTVLLEMNRFAADSTAALSDSSNYDYAVPELSSAPLLAERRARLDSLDGCSPRDLNSLDSTRSSMSVSQEEVVAGVRRRLAAGAVPELPRHRLRMVAKLAEGAFGTVYVAEAVGVPDYEGEVSHEKQLVAVKFLAQDATPQERSEFERDVRILRALSHPCLSRVVGAWWAGAAPAVVLEYLAGGDLCSYLRAQVAPPPARARMRLAAHLAAGMRYLEALNFVHRDLAARNCLVGPDYRLKIADFGTDSEAYAEDYYRAEGREPVPLRWAAWEAALEGRHSTRADVWAFAVTLHEIYTLCRRRPYEHMTDEQVVENLSRLQRGEGSFEMLPRAASCPRDLYAVMAACWRRDPHHRPSFREAHAFLQRRLATTAAS